MTMFRATEFHSLATRESGAAEFLRVKRALSSAETVTIDFAGLKVTPSFADGLLGGLAECLGESAFRARVKLIGIDPSMRPLLNGVISRRLQPSRGHAAA